MDEIFFLNEVFLSYKMLDTFAIDSKQLYDQIEHDSKWIDQAMELLSEKNLLTEQIIEEYSLIKGLWETLVSQDCYIDGAVKYENTPHEMADLLAKNQKLMQDILRHQHDLMNTLAEIFKSSLYYSSTGRYSILSDPVTRHFFLYFLIYYFLSPAFR
jgi:hypothetical protein